MTMITILISKYASIHISELKFKQIHMSRIPGNISVHNQPQL